MLDLFTPACDDALKPFKGRYFSTLEAGIAFYKDYAKVASFDIRLSGAKKSQETVIWRYVVCSREGEKHSASDIVNDDDDVGRKRRRRVSMRCGCPARVSFKFDAMLGYVVQSFKEKHNHGLVQDQYKHFMKINRNLDFMHQKFILDCARANIGPTHSFKLLTEFLGGHEVVGCSVVEVRNFSRDMKAYVEGSDAQMFINELCRKKEICQAFMFDYEVVSEDKLKSVFWCDPVCRRNYHMFGDVVTFDSTYSTNK